MKIPIESLNLKMLNVGFARHHADWNWQGVASPFVRIFLVVEGEARMHLPSGSVVLTPGHAYMVPAYVEHSYECDGDFALYYLHMYEGFKNEINVFEAYDIPTEVEVDDMELALFGAICAQYPDAALPASDPTAYDNNTRLSDYVDAYHRLPLHAKMQLRGFMLMLMARFMEQSKVRIWTKDERMIQVVRHIHNNIYGEVDVERLAAIACVSKNYLIRLFTHTFGMPPVKYVNRKKVERAQLMLVTGQLPVKEIAYRLGFNDHSYFIRLFRQTVGVSPLEYRKRS